MYEKTLNNDNNHSPRNSYQFVENINKLKIVTHDFKDLFKYINLQDLNKIMISLF